MQLLPLTLRNVSQQNRVNPLLAKYDLTDCPFRLEFVPILMKTQNSRLLTHKPRGIGRRAELTNAIDVGSPKPLGQQDIKVLPQNFIAAPSKCLLSPFIESCDALLVIDRDNGFRSDREDARKKQSRNILGCHGDRAPAAPGQSLRVSIIHNDADHYARSPAACFA